MGIAKKASPTPNHPQGNGQSERILIFDQLQCNCKTIFLLDHFYTLLKQIVGHSKLYFNDNFCHFKKFGIPFQRNEYVSVQFPSENSQKTKPTYLAKVSKSTRLLLPYSYHQQSQSFELCFTSMIKGDIML